MDKALTITVTRTLPAPPARVWEAWTEAAAASGWLFRAGGRLLVCDWWPVAGRGWEITEARADGPARHFGTFTEVVPERRLAFTFRTDPGEEPGRVTVDLAPEGEGTRLTLTHEMDAAWAAWEEQTRAGWAEMLASAADRADRAMAISRHLAAPPERVQAAWTDPEVLPRWFGPEGLDCRTERIDLREGGEWVFTMEGGGMSWPNRHRWTAIAPGRIAFLMDGGEGSGPAMEVDVVFLPEGDGTRLVQCVTFPDVAGRIAAEGYDARARGGETLAKLARLIGV